ncbi:efflux RND transporter permease subunit [Algimonas porphyrae]|uniref:Acriflavin resistance protein n=1 Tax=Algimonas porphyrae TaxID=1128113 RepID=A0ABQ5V1P4_9PROT|nr:efflux RND transporter permease subunit [Algimonas porphyrae]GLQ20997.1 acriflavin resistance protein [Algimonas porphyrae]
MEKIVSFAVNAWRVTLGILLFIIVGGFIAIQNLPLDAEPDIPVPFVNVRVVLPGVSPADAERLLVRPLETELKSIDGLKRMDAVAANNVAYIILEFTPSFDQDQAVLDVQEAVDRARAEFPEEAKEPIVEEIDTSTVPIFVVNLFGDVPERTLQNTAKELQQRIEGIPAILGADISGERTDVLEAVVDPTLLESAGITFDELAAAVARNNQLITAGSLETNNGQFNVKLPGLIENADDLAELVVRTDASGAVVRMSDIAVVRRTYKDPQSYARYNSNNSVSLEITKRKGENILDTIGAVREVVEDYQTSDTFPQTIQIEYSQDKSRYILEMVRSLSSSIINAILLVFIVCLIALGLRSALFVGFAIPGSFLISLFIMWTQGETINMMILFGLILSVGVLVDSAIVIIEYADRKLAEGMAAKEAYIMAGERMFWPIISSTATTLAAFLPLLFWETITGKFMAYFPLTMIYVLSASVLMALIFLPTVGALGGSLRERLRRGPKPEISDQALALAGEGGDPTKLTGLTGIYVRTVERLIRFPLIVLGGVMLLCAIIVVAFSQSMAGPPPKPVEFFTQTPSDQVYVFIRARGNSTPAAKRELALDVERRIADARIEGIEGVYAVAGNAGGGGAQIDGLADEPGDAVVKIFFQLEDFADRRSVLDILDDIRVAVADMPGVIPEVTAASNGPPIGKDIGIEFTGRDRMAVAEATRIAEAYLLQMEGVIDVETTLPLPGVEWELSVDQVEAGRLGLDVNRIGQTVQFVTEGALVGYFRPLDNDEEVDIRIRLPEDSRDIRALDDLRIQTPQGAVPLAAVVERRARPREDSITRRNQFAVFEVKANTADGYAPNVQVEELRDWLTDQAGLPRDVNWRFLGQQEENAEAAAFGVAALAAILFMMSVILLLQFNSFYHVLLTLSAVVLSVFGVLLGLIFYPYVSMVLTMTGVIALMGIVVNNNIVLIDTYQRLLERGSDPVEAAVRTAAQRLRPVVLTTVTTVVGLMPLVIGFDADVTSGHFDPRGSGTSDIWKPLSYALVCGLSYATVLTLFLTPVLLAAPHVWKLRIARWRGRSDDRPRQITIQAAE